MGKKRERPFESGPKRRTKLQIGAASSSTKKDGGGAGVFGATFQEASRSQSDHNPLSGLLAQYGDSDDEDSQDNPQRDTEEAIKPKNEIDAKVADFLAEIDALDGIDSPVPSGETSEALPKQTSDAPPQNNTHLDSALSQAVESTTSDVTSTPSEYADPEQGVADSTNNEAGELGEWQELLDEATNCVYYWNTVTSEVTWEIPAALQAANQQLAGQSYDHPLANGTTAQEPEVVEPVVLTESVAKQQEEELTKEDTIMEKLPEINDRIIEKEVKKLPVYGLGAVAYDVSPEPEIEEEEFELQKPEAKKYPMFVKGDSLPGTESIVADIKEAEAVSDESSSTIGQIKPVLMEEEAEPTNGNGESRPEDDDMDIDEQLEMALEKRKAELKELEFDDGASSPCSVDKKRKASETLELYDEKGEVNLLAIKKKRIENLKSKSTVETNDIGTQCDAELDDLAAKQKIKEEAEMKKEIAELSLDLSNKLAFLGITTAELTKFQIMLVEKEVRVRDWREGLLDSKHLLRHLKSSDWELQRYEMEATPSGWSCTWDREHKQYYYTDNQTGTSQWDFPMDAVTLSENKGEETPVSTNSAQTASQSLFNQASLTQGTEHGQYVQSAPLVPVVQDTSQSQAYSTYIASSSIPEPQAMEYTTPYIPPTPAPAPPKTPAPPLPAPPLPDPVPPPSLPAPSLPNPPLPSSYHKPPPPPPGTELFPPLPDSPPPPLPSGSGPELPPLPPSPPPPPPPEEDDEGACDSTRTMTPPPVPIHHPEMINEGMDIPSSSATPSSSTVIGKPQLLYSGSATMADSNYSAPVLYSALPSVAAPPQGVSLSGLPTAGAQPVTGKTKKKKEKTKKSTSKKNKLPLVLVQKWQQIKEEVEREEKANDEEEDEEDDPNVVAQKRIAQWKKEQMAVGLSTKNANFEMIQGDWRERLKRKSNASS
ncbi:formin-binding protein 4-like [Asterias amurensis]|uniref:formin-binding protein 4-like n=1 Tax=Asterias amurensis TaxID=7602 RepID=UPI003AB7F815